MLEYVGTQHRADDDTAKTKLAPMLNRKMEMTMLFIAIMFINVGRCYLLLYHYLYNIKVAQGIQYAIIINGSGCIVCFLF